MTHDEAMAEYYSHCVTLQKHVEAVYHLQFISSVMLTIVFGFIVILCMVRAFGTETNHRQSIGYVLLTLAALALYLVTVYPVNVA